MVCPATVVPHVWDCGLLAEGVDEKIARTSEDFNASELVCFLSANFQLLWNSYVGHLNPRRHLRGQPLQTVLVVCRACGWAEVGTAWAAKTNKCSGQLGNERFSDPAEYSAFRVVGSFAWGCSHNHGDPQLQRNSDDGWIVIAWGEKNRRRRHPCSDAHAYLGSGDCFKIVKTIEQNWYAGVETVYADDCEPLLTSIAAVALHETNNFPSAVYRGTHGG